MLPEATPRFTAGSVAIAFKIVSLVCAPIPKAHRVTPAWLQMALFASSASSWLNPENGRGCPSVNATTCTGNSWLRNPGEEEAARKSVRASANALWKLVSERTKRASCESVRIWSAMAEALLELSASN